MTLGDRINFVRKDNKMNQSEFAKTLGISQAHVSKIEKNIEKPSETLLLFISHLFQVNIEWLKNEEGERYKYYGWDLSDDGLESKYTSFKNKADNLLNIYTGKDRQCFVEAFCFFITLTAAPKLDEEKRSQYLISLHKLMDYLERLQFKSNTYTIFDPNKKVNYEHLFTHINDLNEIKNTIDSSIDEMLNIYLSKFNLPYKF